MHYGLTIQILWPLFEKYIFVTQIYDTVYILEDGLSNLLLYPGGFIA